MISTNFTICSKTDVKRLSRPGRNGVQYPWYDKSIQVGKGFFIERSAEDMENDRGRPSIPTQKLAEYGIQYRTYKGEYNGRHGYFCERIK